MLVSARVSRLKTFMNEHCRDSELGTFTGFDHQEKGYLEEIGPKLDLETENLESQRRG